MKRLLVAVLMLSVCVNVLAQTNGFELKLGTEVADVRPISEGVKYLVATPTLLIPTSIVGQKAASIIDQIVTYIATNGIASVGVGNTLDKIGEGTFTEVMNVKYELPIHIPTNRFVNLKLSGLQSTCFSAKNHVGLGIGASLVFHVTWLEDTGILFFKRLSDINLGANVAPDIDEAVGLRFSSDTTVGSVDAGWKFAF